MFLGVFRPVPSLVAVVTANPSDLLLPILRLDACHLASARLPKRPSGSMSVYGPSRHFAAMKQIGRNSGHCGHWAALEPRSPVVNKPTATSAGVSSDPRVRSLNEPMQSDVDDKTYDYRAQQQVELTLHCSLRKKSLGSNRASGLRVG
jgi:hypothetical protein